MVLKNKTIRYKVLFNIMKKINLFYKERNLFFIFYRFTYFFHFEHLFGGIHIKFFFLIYYFKVTTLCMYV